MKKIALILLAATALSCSKEDVVQCRINVYKKVHKKINGVFVEKWVLTETRERSLLESQIEQGITRGYNCLENGNCFIWKKEVTCY